MLLAFAFADPSRSNESQPHWAVVIHLATVIPAFFLGIVVMRMKKGTQMHRILGRIWGMLMIVTAIDSFWLQGLFGGIGPIHIFSVITLISIPRGIIAIRQGNIRAHERAMTGPFIGLCVAGAFSFIPGRVMGNAMLALF
jgi:uncharacterized membrane protein